MQGPTVMREYWQNPEATSDAFQEAGWFRPGDAGFLDPEGILGIVERIKEIIVASSNVYPADLEAVLVSCSEIAWAAVVGRPYEQLEEIPVAFVVLNQPGAISATEVKRLFEGRLAEYKRRQDVIFTDALPRNAIGKVQKAWLRDSLRRCSRPSTDPLRERQPRSPRFRCGARR